MSQALLTPDAFDSASGIVPQPVELFLHTVLSEWLRYAGGEELSGEEVPPM